MRQPLSPRRQSFLSTPSARRATDIISRDAYARLFLSTPSARRATHRNRTGRRGVGISIHALREEGDLALVVADAGDVPISIHALREEGDRRGYGNNRYIYSFLSTPSARRATLVP